MNKMIFLIGLIASAMILPATEMLFANYCLQGGGVATYIGKDKKGRAIVKEGVNCHVILSDEVMRPIPCPPQKNK